MRHDNGKGICSALSVCALHAILQTGPVRTVPLEVQALNRCAEFPTEGPQNTQSWPAKSHTTRPTGMRLQLAT